LGDKLLTVGTTKDDMSLSVFQLLITNAGQSENGLIT